MSRSSVLSVTGVTRKYGAQTALADVTLDLRDGVTGLLGVNGAGKTTLLSVIAGVLAPDAGEVIVCGSAMFGRRKERRDASRRVAFMPQLTQFPKNLTAREVVSLILWLRGLSSARADRLAEDALDRVNLGNRRDAKMGSLSGGMVRRVALAQALATDAEVLLLDEPSTGLDPEQRRAMVTLIQQMPGSVLFSSHVIEDIEDTATSVVVIDSGRVLFHESLTALAAIGEQYAATSDVSGRLEAAFLHMVTRNRAAEIA